MQRFIARLVHTFRRGQAERDVAREIAAHLRLLEDEYARRGLTPDQARVAARRAMGSVALAQDRHRDARSFVWLEDSVRDVTYAVRGLVRQPGFAAAAVATLGLGIGASTAIFSVAYGVSLRPLPYTEPDRLIRIYESNPANGLLTHDVSEGAFHAWREGVGSLQSIALHGRPGTRFMVDANQTPVTMMSVSPAFFDLLGARPLLGAGFKPERDYTRFTADDEAMISHAAWHRLFGGRSDVIGQLLEFSGAGDNDIYRIVGVMPEGFAFGEPVDLWRPVKIIELPIGPARRTLRSDGAIARLRPGIPIEQVRAELETVSARLAREYPASSAGWTVTVESLHAASIGNFGRATWLLLAAVIVVLLVTCVNVGGLLVARAVAREPERAVRAALGAGTWRLIRLWIAEASVLGALGATTGLLLAWSGVAALKAAAPPGIPRLDAIAVDLPTFVVAGVSALLAVVVFAIAGRDGLALGPSNSLSGRFPGVLDGRNGNRTRSALIVVQCAGAAALVVLATMLTRSFTKLTAVDLGWDSARLVSLQVSLAVPPALRRPWYRFVEWSDHLIARLEATPGIERAAITTQLPLSPQISMATLVRGRGSHASDPDRWPGVQQNVTDGYFDLMGIRLLRGRVFTPADRFSEAQLTSPRPAERGVVIVSETTARTLWPGRSALGEALWLPGSDLTTWREVIGVVEDIQFHSVGESPALHVFVPWTQLTTGRPVLLVKTSTDDASDEDVIRGAVRSAEPGTRITQVARLDALVSRATAHPRFATVVVSLFGGLALLLAAIGIHGTLSCLVATRRREIGIRLALGAPRGEVLSRTVWRGLAPAINGLLVGLPIAWALARLFPTLLFEVGPYDAGSSLVGALLLTLVAVVAALLPARRATKVDPAVALRAE
jgi:putative ABC transport system permease protein